MSYSTHQTSHWGCWVITHHSAHSSRFLSPEGLLHLEHIHHTLCLAPLNGGGYGTEHATAAHHITAGQTYPHSHTHGMATACLPAVYHNGLVVCFHLNSNHLLNHSTQARAATIKEVCYQYWPNTCTGSQMFGEFKVEVLGEERLQGFVMRSVSVEDSKVSWTPHVM